MPTAGGGGATSLVGGDGGFGAGATTRGGAACASGFACAAAKFVGRGGGACIFTLGAVWMIGRAEAGKRPCIDASGHVAAGFAWMEVVIARSGFAEPAVSGCFALDT